MKKTYSLICFLVALLVALLPAGSTRAAGISVEITGTFDYPDAVLTYAYGINNHNQVVGSYVDGVSGTLGYIRAANGNFSAPLMEPDAVISETVPLGINDDGTVCGFYFGGSGFEGFLYAGGTYTTYNVLGLHPTELTGINNAGDLSATVLSQTGYVVIGGTVSSVEIPGASLIFPRGINAGDQVTGTYFDANNQGYGFYSDGEGVLHYPVAVPRAKKTLFYGLNDLGYMVGGYTTGSGRNMVTHGLLFVPPNKFVTVDYTGATEVLLTGINTRGIICGYYTDSAHKTHGLLARVRGGGP